MATDVIDIAFALSGGGLPRGYRRLLGQALATELPWLSAEPGAGWHPLKVAPGGAQTVSLARRTRLMLRVPRARADDAEQLSGRELRIGGASLRVGEARRRELLPWGTLYAHCVAAAVADERAFLDSVQADLAALGVSGRAICGRAQHDDAGAFLGFSLMIDGLSAEDSLTVQRMGLGTGRQLGRGLFVPHKSAAAVGTPA